MNKLTWPRPVFPQTATADEPMIDLVETFRLLWRRRLLLGGVLALAIAAAVVYLLVATPRYTATSMLMFDVRQADPLQQPAFSNAATDSAYVDSQVEILQSEALARSVITKLGLEADPEFSPPPNPIAALIAHLVAMISGSDDAAAETDRLTRLVTFFRSNLLIKRVGLTYVVNVAYRSLDPVKAAKISNAVVDAYVVAQLDSKFNAARQAGTWIQARVDELKAKAQSADRAVAEYKAKNNITNNISNSTAGGGDRAQTESDLVALSAERRANLRELETTAQISRTLYDSFVQRASQQQSFPTTEARVVSAATPPLERSSPKTLLVLAGATLIGLVGGVGAAFAREHLNIVFLSPTQLERDLGVNCIGVIPAMPRGMKIPKRARAAQQKGASARRFIMRDPDRFTCAVDSPHSACTEAIRFPAADITCLSPQTKIIGISSALPDEGKSMTAANVAEFVAAAGRKVLLVDCDLRKAGLTRQLAPEAARGLPDAIAGRAAVNDILWRDPLTKLDFLPASRQHLDAAHPSGTLASAPMRALLESVRDQYDYVILDLPPIIPVADVKAASHLIDAFILVIEWGRTTQSAVIEALSMAPLVGERLLGALLNKANSNVLRQLESYRGTVPFSEPHAR